MYKKAKSPIISCIITFCFSTAVGVSAAGTPWTVKVDESREVITIEHEVLGVVMEECRLEGDAGGEGKVYSGWEYSPRKRVLKTAEPSPASWGIVVREDGINITSATENAFFTGRARADEYRIPARTQNQDNGVMYTSLGYITANNLHNLFDIPHDIMIHFPAGTRMVRDEKNKKVMVLRMPVGEDAEITVTPEYYKDVLRLKYYTPRPPRFDRAPCGWCSWYCYYMDATQEKMVQSTDAIAEHLRDYGMEYIQLDACYTRGEEANWLEWTKKTFPKGGKWLFDYIRAKGMRPGLWMNCYGANHAKPACAEKYPEHFYLRNTNGEVSQACCSADDTVVRLDYSNPAVYEKHLIPLFKTLKKEWGLEYLKSGGWGQYIEYFNENRERAHDPGKTGREVYVKVQHTVRDVLGREVYINGCAMHEVGLGFGIFDGSRTGSDDRAVWFGMEVYFKSLFGANYLNNICWFCDPDTVMVRPPLTLDEARTIVSTIALCGQTYMASDFMDKLTKERLALYKKTIPVMEIVPVDLYPYKPVQEDQKGIVWSCPNVTSFPRAMDLKVDNESGVYDVVGLFNWEEEPQEITVQLEEDLGLEKDAEYLAFNFWDPGVKRLRNGVLSATVPVHGTEAYILRRDEGQPVLMGTSRHITCAQSIQEIKRGKDSIKGTSTFIEGEPYSVYFYLPEGTQFAGAEADAEIAYHKQEGGLLEVAFSGRVEREGQATVTWEIAYE